jgi:hypothetical protein
LLATAAATKYSFAAPQSVAYGVIADVGPER